MSENDDELDRLLRDYRTLSPEQHDRLVRRVVARARAHRRETIRFLLRQLFGWIGGLAGWISRRAAVLRLQKLDDRSLKDIGISRGEIEVAVRPCRQDRPHDRVGRAA